MRVVVRRDRLLVQRAEVIRLRETVDDELVVARSFGRARVEVDRPGDCVAFDLGRDFAD